MRLFVAAYPPADVRAHFGEMVDRLAVARPMPTGRSTRLATPDRWHLTLAFIGEVEDDRVEHVIEALRDLSIGAPTVRIAGGGRFGRGKFTTLVANVRDETAGLKPLGDAVRKGLRRKRVPFDHRPLQPHVTIARPGDRLSAQELATDLATLAEYEGPQWLVDELRLVRSSLGPTPEYEAVTNVALSIRSAEDSAT